MALILHVWKFEIYIILRPPLWSSGQSFWLQIKRSRVRSPALQDFLSSSVSGTESTQPREVKLRSYLNKKSSGSRFRKVGTNFAYRRRPLFRSVGMVRSRAKAKEFSLVYYSSIFSSSFYWLLFTVHIYIYHFSAPRDFNLYHAETCVVFSRTISE